MSIRDEIKRPARRALHEKMKIPALYLATSAGTPVPVGVRDHTKFNALGELKGGGAGWAEMQDVTPRLIFQRSEMQPANGAFVCVELGEVYQINNARPADDEFVTVEVTRLSDKQILQVFPAGHPVPS